MAYSFTLMYNIYVLTHHLHKIELFIRHSHLLSPVGILILSIIRPFILLPISFIGLSVPLMYRFGMSLLLINISAVISASVLFFAARCFSERIQIFLSDRLDAKYLNMLEQNKFELIFFLRLSMLVHFDLLSLLAGLSGISYRGFLLASFVGFFPESILFSAVSIVLENPGTFFRFVPYILAYGLIVYIVRKKIRKGKVR
ncbi:SNARE associated Golgi protein [Desulfofarcimen acetoxidans DSM 771]|uniref:TVP38/TMEM64 family membrane protein n=1 Tax=Desulfofarcimen acetoxidans (strain ATCC 49208 / DSM 771 / KCTC 5769 / VKM B-1644 / 5575) TaxID=485916 RepID=C8W2L6_DESAS|nr:VTT domain-containing protein [Desulfofarcimen acetoxidans]ACV63700.1 SNARE associated Golgi protein [Desulfofarcimen acetoxidans DSM 771]